MLWAAHEPQMDELTLPSLGGERCARQYPFGDLLRAGVTLAAGSDWPVSGPDPPRPAMSRSTGSPPTPPGGTPEFLPGQRLDLGAAIAAHTAGSAYVKHLDDITGSIAMGKPTSSCSTAPPSRARRGDRRHTRPADLRRRRRVHAAGNA